MIVVTFDFRVGAMGYFGLPANMTLSSGDDVFPPPPTMHCHHVFP
jgi:hypothetical protein